MLCGLAISAGLFTDGDCRYTSSDVACGERCQCSSDHAAVRHNYRLPKSCGNCISSSEHCASDWAVEECLACPTAVASELYVLHYVVMCVISKYHETFCDGRPWWIDCNGIFTDLFIVGYWHCLTGSSCVVYCWWSTVFLQCFDTVGWVTERAAGLYKISHHVSSKVLLWKTDGRHNLATSDLWKIDWLNKSGK